MTPSRSLFETAYRRLRRTIKPAVVALMNGRSAAAIARSLFRHGITRTVLNEVYERFGSRFIGGRLDSVLSRGPADTEFLWKCRMGGRNVVLPVSPALAGSWPAAKSWSQESTKPIRAFYECLLRHTPRGIFFDVGANRGIHSYPFAAQGYQCIAFEPQQGCVEYMCRVNALNSFRAFTVEQCAVGEDRADLEFFVSDLTWYSSFNRSHVERYEAAKPIRVNSVSLDAYCLAHEVAPTVMKIDVEGWEWQVLTGATKVLERARPSIVIEVFPWASYRDRLWAWFLFLGYVAYAGRRRSGRPLRPIRSEEEFLKAPESDFIFVADRELSERCDADIVH